MSTSSSDKKGEQLAGPKLNLHSAEARWFAVYTRFQREKLIHKRLKEKGIHSYLPLLKLTRHYTRKIRTVELPLISCYIFVCITKKEYVSVLQTPDVVDFVKFSNQLIAIPEYEIRLMRRVVEEGAEVETESLKYCPGDRVEIISGQLAGIEGILLNKDGKKNFLIELNQIGYSLRINVDPSMIRKAGEKHRPDK